MTGPLRLIVNPAAGHGRARRLLPQATAALEAAGSSFSITESASLAHARDLAATAAGNGEAVIAVGGDGMAGAVCGAAAAGGAPFGIIPAGRGNDFARVLGIPSDPAAAARVLAAGRQRLVDLIAAGTAGGPESVVAGSVYAGVPSVAGEIANATRWLNGPLTYPVAALRALARWQPATFRVEITASQPGSPGPPGAGGSAGPPAGPSEAAPGSQVHEFDGYAVVVANAAYFGAGMQVAPPAVIDDGLLDAVLMHRAGRLTFVRALLRVRTGSHVAMPQVTLDRGATVTLSVSRDLPAGADGELLPCAAPLASGQQLVIRALHGALRALVPPS